MRFTLFIILCAGICALAVSAPLGGWTFVPILGLASGAASVLPPQKPVRPFDGEWD